jgi:hypothetical protein
MKAFISYSSRNQETAREISDFLETVQMNSFIAKDDLRAASNWKDTIVKELGLCDIFIPLLSKDFKESSWCSQEIGIAFILGKKFIPISLDDTRSYGFINHIQSKSITQEKPLELIIAEGLMECKIPNGVQCFIRLLEISGNFRYSEHVYKGMEPYFMEFSSSDLNTIIKLSINNGRIFNASKCSKKYIPCLLAKRKDDIVPDLYEKLNCRITNDEWYNEN